ncbi:MAG TPA: immunoglobulin-like domain-containing protein [Candidatus Paceibacterota bacterium]|nr:immunoglobulin-like domain-containing protein [Candidatus Paceibacterota bacterium]
MPRYTHEKTAAPRRARGTTRLGGLLLALIVVLAGVASGVPGRLMTLASVPRTPLLAAAAAADATGTAPIGAAATSMPALAGAPSKLGINVPLELSRPLSAQSATFAKDVSANSLTISGSATFGSPLSSHGPATIDGLLEAEGGVSTNGADIDLGGGKLFASNVLSGITAGTNVTITGPANHPTISVSMPQQQAPIFFGGGGGGLSSITAGSGLSGGTITGAGTLALNLASANVWSALQSFGAGASTTDLVIAGTATTSALSITSATSTLLKTDASGAVIPAIAGVDYELPGGPNAADWLVTDGALSPTSTIGILIGASSTVGDGSQAGGLTVAGGATTTGDAYIGGNMAAAGALSITGTTTLASIASGLVKSVGGVLSAAIAGTDYVATSTLGSYFSLPDWYATTTDALAEGPTNKYYTDARVQSYLDSLSKGYYFGTTSAAYFLSQNQGLAFSTSSANYLLSTKGYGTFGYLFPNDATTTGLGFYASTTIGDGTQAGGLTIAGNATTTGSLTISGTATSTFASGIDLASGCLAVNGACVGSDPWVVSGAAISYGMGNVGIGTTTTPYALTVAGDGSVSGAFTAKSTFMAGEYTRALPWLDRTEAGTRDWAPVTSSSDGTHIAAAVYGGDIYTSTDDGATWTDRTAAGSRNWQFITSSSDGMKLAAVVNGGDIYTSTDGGAIWTDRTAAGSRSWQSVTSSSDGTYLAAAAYNGDIYTSADGGATWTDRTAAGARYWRSVTSSSDGTRLAAADGAAAGYIYTSTDGGATWTVRTAAGGQRYWQSITSSSDGMKLAAVVNGGDIYTSTDGGATWTDRTAAGSRSWHAIASSADGSLIIASADNGNVYTSSDSGATWTEQTALASGRWLGVSMSADGTKLVAAALGGDIWVYDAAGIQTPSFIVDSTTHNVGVGSTTPGSLLAVGDRNGINFSTATSTFSSIGGINLSAGCFAVDGTCIGTVPWATNGSAISYTAGNVGIGTTTPFAALSVAGNTFLGGTLTATGTVSFANALGISSGGTGLGTAPAYGNLLLGNASGGYDLVATSSLGISAPWTTNGSTVSYIAGNVGIGTTSPFAKLAVAGDGYFTGGLTASSSLVAGLWQTSVGGGFGTPVWTDRTSAGIRNWHAITSSSDGTKLAAVDASGYIYTSTDSGATWTARAATGSQEWQSITSSADGTKLTAAVAYGDIFTSTDGGATWTDRTAAGSKVWYAISSSADGTKLAAAVYAGDIFTSADGGATWIDRTASGSRNWVSITSSSDGTKLAAVVNGGDIYTSTDSGATWTDQAAAGSRDWMSITSSSDGTKLAAAAGNGDIFTSTDGGATWIDRTAAGTRRWTAITSSADGTALAAAVNSGGHIYTSADGGVTWTDQTVAGGRSWTAIASSADGAKLAAAVYNGDIYTYNAPYTPPTITKYATFTVDGSTHNVGVGTTTPSMTLQVAGSIGPTASSTYNLGSATYNWGCLYYDGGTLGTCASDERLKTNIHALSFDMGSSTALDQIAGLSLHSFAYKTASTTIYHGLIAQEVRNVAPELVAVNAATGFFEVRYGDVQWLMLEALQQLIAKVDALESAVAGFAQAFASDKLTAGNELCVGDTCVTPAQFKAIVAAAGVAAAGTSTEAATPAPTITLLGANPAAVSLNATYNDLGATAKDAEGHDLGITYTVNGSTTPAVSLDTSTSTTYTIIYTATDTDGRSASATRTVYVGAATSTAPTGTDATSTPKGSDGTAPGTEQDQTNANDTASSTPSVSADASSTPSAGSLASSTPSVSSDATSTAATSTPK